MLKKKVGHFLGLPRNWGRQKRLKTTRPLPPQAANRDLIFSIKIVKIEINSLLLETAFLARKNSARGFPEKPPRRGVKLDFRTETGGPDPPKMGGRSRVSGGTKIFEKSQILTLSKSRNLQQTVDFVEKMPKNFGKFRDFPGGENFGKNWSFKREFGGEISGFSGFSRPPVRRKKFFGKFCSRQKISRFLPVSRTEVYIFKFSKNWKKSKKSRFWKIAKNFRANTKFPPRGDFRGKITFFKWKSGGRPGGNFGGSGGKNRHFFDFFSIF